MKGLKTSQGICLVSAVEIAPQQFASTSTTSGLTLRKAPSMSATSIAARRTNTSIVLLTTRNELPVVQSRLCRDSMRGSTRSAVKPNWRHRSTPAWRVRTWTRCPREASSLSRAQNGKR